MGNYDLNVRYDEDYAYDFGMSIAILLPTGDLETGSWVTAPLYSKIDEVNYSDSDFINSDYSISSPAEVKLSGINYTPFFTSGVYDQIIQYRLERNSDSEVSLNANVELFNGNKLIKQISHKNVQNGFSQYAIYLNQEEAASISSYNDLSLRFFDYHNNLFQNVSNYWDFQNTGVDLYGKADLVGVQSFTSTTDGSGLSLNSTEAQTSEIYLPNLNQSGLTLISRIYAGNLTTEDITWFSKSGLGTDYLRLISTSSNQEFNFTGVSNSVNFSVSKVVGFTDNVRYFIGLVLDPISGKASIYVNSSGVVADSTLNFNDLYSPLIFNQFNSGSQLKIDDTILYQRVLTSGEIMTIYNNGTVLDWTSMDE